MTKLYRGIWQRRLVNPARELAVFGARVVLNLLPVFIIGSLVTFLLSDLAGINPAFAKLGQGATESSVAAFDRSFGLHKPFFVRYGDWLWQIVHGNLGTSWIYDVPVGPLLLQRAVVSLSVAGLALLVGIIGGSILGSLAAVFRNSWFDRSVTLFTTVTSAMPAFTVGILLVAIFATALHWLPAAGYVSPSAGLYPWFIHVILPAAALSFDATADIARQLRVGLVAETSRPYTVGAAVRGLSRRRIFFVHVLRNGVAPAIAILGLKFANLLGGAVVVEAIFAIPGYGVLTSQAALSSDVPVVQGSLIVSIVLVVAFNLLVNIIHGRLVPSSKAGV